MAADVAPDVPGHRCSSARRWPSSSLIARRGTTTPWPTLAWLAVFFLIGAYASAGVAWWPLGAVAAIAGVARDRPGRRPVEPRPTPPLIRRAQRSRSSARSSLVGRRAAAGLAAARPGPRRPAGRRRHARRPGSPAALRDLARPGDRLFNPQPWGSWFEFALPDRARSRSTPGSSSSRPRSGTTTTASSSGGRGWQEQLGDWGVTLVVVARRRGGFADRLAAAGWRSRTSDEDGTVLRRARTLTRAGDRVPRSAVDHRAPVTAAHRAARVGRMTERTPDLDVVVLGGGGHVGLPLSLAFAEAGLRVGIYDTNQATLDRIAAGEMPFMETGADELLREVLPTGRLTFGTDGAMIERTDQLVVVIGTPVDEFLGPSMTIFEKAVDQIAPHLRDGALVVLRSTVYPGTTGYVAQHLAERGCRVDVAFCPERIAEGHALEELHTLPQIIGADDDRAADRAERAVRHARLARRSARRPKEAELAKLFTNTWRYMKFAVANQFFMIADQAGRRLHERPARDPRGLPARRRPAGPRLRRRPVPVQGHDAAGRLHGRPLPARPGRHAGQRGPAGLHRVGPRAPLRRAAGQDRRHPRHGLQGRVGRPARVAQLQAPQAPVVGRRPRPRHRSVRPRRPPRLRSTASSPRATSWSSARRTRPYRGLEVGGKDVVDVWGALGEGIRL